MEKERKRMKKVVGEKELKKRGGVSGVGWRRRSRG
jgi:hypothetical protein